MKVASVLLHRGMEFMLLGVTLASLGIGIYLTRGGKGGVLKTAASSSAEGVDESALITARSLAGVAHGLDEQRLAAQALLAANHAVDQAFETALRETKSDTASPTAESLAGSQKIAALETTVEAEKQHVVALTTARLKTASQDDVADLGEQAQAQLDLDSDRLNDLHREQILRGGEKYAKVQQALDEHDAMQAKPIGIEPSENDLESSQNLVTLQGKVRGFLEMRDREMQLERAAEEATLAAARLTQQKGAVEKENELSRSSPQKTISEYEASIHDQEELTTIYRSWAELTKGKRVTVLHGILQALAILVTLSLAVLLGMVLIRREFARWMKGRRRLDRYPVIAERVVEVLALAVILIVVFGTPTWMSLILGR